MMDGRRGRTAIADVGSLEAVIMLVALERP